MRSTAMQANWGWQADAPFGRESSTGRPLAAGRRVTVAEWEQGVLFRHGRLERVLEPGAHRRWGGGFTLRHVDLRPWVVLVPTQEVPTADGASVKLTMAGRARVADARTWITAARDAESALYLTIQVALRDVVAALTIEDLLAGRADLGDRVLAQVRGIDELGLALDQLQVKDIILPGELRSRAEGQATRQHSALAAKPHRFRWKEGEASAQLLGAAGGPHRPGPGPCSPRTRPGRDGRPAQPGQRRPVGGGHPGAGPAPPPAAARELDGPHHRHRHPAPRRPGA